MMTRSEALQRKIRNKATDRLITVAAKLDYIRYHGDIGAHRSELWGELGELLEVLGARLPCPRCKR